VRSVILSLSVLLAIATSVRADPIMECGVLARDGAVSDCLRTQLEVSYQAMDQGLDLARAAAEELDRTAGGDAAVLGLEASQQAWEAYRDVECQTLAMFVAGALPAETAQLACEIRLMRARTDTLLRFAGQGS
jgi:uncharacterized protein YecT (DUF1311 family)